MSPLDDSVLFEMFGESQLRLTIVEWLSTQHPPVDLEGVSRTVADAHELPAEVVRLRLHHVHLPKLAQLGLLTYDVRNSRVEGYSPSRLANAIERFTTAFPGFERTFLRNDPSAEGAAADSDSGLVAGGSLDDGGHVEIPPPRGNDEG